METLRHAIIIAGGRGERLRPYTEDRPKPMVPLMGSPLLSYSIKWLTGQGIDDITICCGHMHEVIVDYFGDGSKFGAKINYLIEEKPLGRGGAIRAALETINAPERTVLAMNGDIMTNLNLNELYAFHRAQGGMVSLTSVPLVSPYGIVDISEDGSVEGFREKPELPFWINAGIYLMNTEVTPLLPVKGDHEVSTFPQLAAQGKLKCYRSRAFWRAVDTVKDLTELRNECEQLFFGTLFSNPEFFPAPTTKPTPIRF